MKLREISGYFPSSLYFEGIFYGRKKVLNSWHKYIISPHLDHESPREGCGHHPHTPSLAIFSHDRGEGGFLPWGSKLGVGLPYTPTQQSLVFRQTILNK